MAEKEQNTEETTQPWWKRLFSKKEPTSIMYDQDDLREITKLINDTAKETGAGRNIMWGDVKKTIIGIVDQCANSIRVIPNWIGLGAVMAEPVTSWGKQQAEVIITRQKELNVIKFNTEFTKKLEQKYIAEHSPQELKNIDPQHTMTYIKKIIPLGQTVMEEKAKKISSIVAMGVTAVGVVAACYTAPWYLAAAVATTTAGACFARSYMNKKQIKRSVAANGVRNDAVEEQNKHLNQTFNAAPSFTSVKGLSEKMGDVFNGPEAVEKIQTNREIERQIFSNFCTEMTSLLAKDNGSPKKKKQDYFDQFTKKMDEILKKEISPSDLDSQNCENIRTNIDAFNSKMNKIITGEENNGDINEQEIACIRQFVKQMNYLNEGVAGELRVAEQEQAKAQIENNSMNISIKELCGAVAVWGVMSLAAHSVGFAELAAEGLALGVSTRLLYLQSEEAIMNYINSRLHLKEAYEKSATSFHKLKPRNLDYYNGKEQVNALNNEIVLSQDLAYQHHIYKGEKSDKKENTQDNAEKNNKDIAPLSGTNLFQMQSEMTIGKGITILGGASGAGKSSLIGLLTRDDLPTQGSIRMGYHNDNGEFVSQNYADLDKNSIPDQIAIAHQDLKPSSFISVEEYIKLGNPHADPEKVQAVKDLLHIDTKGENGAIDCTKMLDHNFSGGQQKRIELARALIQDSPIMILDEPTSGVDETMTKDIVAYLKELGKEKTIVYITHDAREISAIGATRAIDIDKFWSKDHSQNTAAHIDLTAPGAMEQYTKFFTNRSVHEKEEEKKKEQEEKLNNIKENKETHRAVQTELQSARNLLNNKNTPPSQQPKEPETSLVSKAKENTVSLGKVPNGVVGRS